MEIQFEGSASGWKSSRPPRSEALAERFRYAFSETYKPVLDDAPLGAFDTMEDYRHGAKK